MRAKGGARRWFVCCIAAIALIVPALLISGLVGYVRQREFGTGVVAAGSAYAAAIEDARRSGIPTTPEALQQTLPPAEQNAAPLYERITQILTDHPLKGEDAILSNLAFRGVPTEGQYARARLALKRRAALVALIHKAVSRPACVFVRDWRFPTAIPIRELMPMRDCSRVLGGESLLMLRAGNPLQAVRNDTLRFRLAEQARAAWQGRIGGLTAEDIDFLVIHDLQRILCLAGDRADVDDAVRTAIETGWKPTSLAVSLRAEAGMHVLDVEVLRQEGPASLPQWLGDSSAKPLHMGRMEWNRFCDDNGLLLLQISRSAGGVADLPYPQSAPALRRIEQSIDQDRNPTHVLALVMGPTFLVDAAERGVSLQARVDATRCAAAVLAWKARHGTFPAALDQAMRPVALDPFDGAPLRYRREGAGFEVYSVGNTLRYDGGSPRQKPGRETVFRYPLPPYDSVLIMEQ
jgi:hypothetical protein